MTIAYSVLDVRRGNVLDEFQGGSRRAHASLTKLMTAHVIFNEIASGAYTIHDKTSIPPSVKRETDMANLNMDGGPGFRYCEDGVPPLYQIDDLLKASAGFSDGFATAALVAHSCRKSFGTGASPDQFFIGKMNDVSASIGIRKNTRFVNTTGMPARNHYSTPNDVAFLLRSLYQNHHRLFIDYFGQSEYQLRSIQRSFYNTSSLIGRHEYPVCGKTGFTQKAGYCFGGVINYGASAHAIVVFNAQSPQERDQTFIDIAQRHAPKRYVA
jgi:D-alanyl-D-alanine carboxypeptidase (penicillin-binding protein 5/6)